LYLNIANAYKNWGESELANEFFTKCIELDENNANYWLSRAFSNYSLGIFLFKIKPKVI
jgi:hypothetical protein